MIFKNYLNFPEIDISIDQMLLNLITCVLSGLSGKFMETMNCFKVKAIIFIFLGKKKLFSGQSDTKFSFFLSALDTQYKILF